MSEPKRKPTNLSLDADLVRDAKSLAVNVSRAAETGIAQAVADERARRWKLENAQAISSWNDWHEQNGLPLAEFRQF